MIQVAEWITSPTLGSREAPTKVNALDEDDLRFWITLSSDEEGGGGARLKQPMTPFWRSPVMYILSRSEFDKVLSSFLFREILCPVLFHGEREEINLFY